jgi:hypothetical protein
VLAIGVRIESLEVMRGSRDPRLTMLTSFADPLIPADHPIRRIRVVVDAVLAELELIR